ncbi:CidA/LrgA family protein [Hydrocarboniclastica marina]|uniref:CidA/LrgA family protein n=1 Tax=Hydrocarboniclastica marina TaxID=2259620 RepID=A0A4P7XJP2_9ALTE|nr:CidA/LrgA family protein [Hydrocarboniclastica marina]MAL98188.1 CidA/LrgA family protein [Alteromonadaceae bacterium]QCF27025.1 CidA/LrgA family protein [Hydrocarboniclastica marina]|tara:strand:- start:81 stop:443 length:363 start_codon:yes stop_codon:yes gene_type:complete
MPLLRGFLTLMIFLLLGESLRFLLAWPISGGVGGMLILTIWLVVTGRVSDELAAASQGLISVLIVLIMPGVVGVFFLGDRFDGQWLAVGVALVLGTALSVLTTFLLMMRFTPKDGQDSHD